MARRSPRRPRDGIVARRGAAMQKIARTGQAEAAQRARIELDRVHRWDSLRLACHPRVLAGPAAWRVPLRHRRAPRSRGLERPRSAASGAARPDRSSRTSGANPGAARRFVGGRSASAASTSEASDTPQARAAADRRAWSAPEIETWAPLTVSSVARRSLRPSSTAPTIADRVDDPTPANRPAASNATTTDPMRTTVTASPPDQPRVDRHGTGGTRRDPRRPDHSRDLGVVSEPREFLRATGRAQRQHPARPGRCVSPSVANSATSRRLVVVIGSVGIVRPTMRRRIRLVKADARLTNRSAARNVSDMDATQSTAPRPASPGGRRPPRRPRPLGCRPSGRWSWLPRTGSTTAYVPGRYLAASVPGTIDLLVDGRPVGGPAVGRGRRGAAPVADAPEGLTLAECDAIDRVVAQAWDAHGRAA